MNSLFGDTIRNDIDYKHEFKSERWMETEYDERVENYHKKQKGAYFVKLKNDEGIHDDDDETSKSIRRPSHLGAFAKAKEKMNRFMIIIDGIKIRNVYHLDTISFLKKRWTYLNKAGYVWE